MDDNKIFKLEQEVYKYKQIVQRVYKIVIRGLVLLKFAVRAGAITGTYFFINPLMAYYLAGFIFVLMLVQLVLDRVRQAVNDKVELSEWNVLP
jgi:hypothetical protein